jgi:hypothetical protein
VLTRGGAEKGRSERQTFEQMVFISIIGVLLIVCVYARVLLAGFALVGCLVGFARKSGTCYPVIWYIACVVLSVTRVCVEKRWLKFCHRYRAAPEDAAVLALTRPNLPKGRLGVDQHSHIVRPIRRHIHLLGCMIGIGEGAGNRQNREREKKQTTDSGKANAGNTRLVGCFCAVDVPIKWLRL